MSTAVALMVACDATGPPGPDLLEPLPDGLRIVAQSSEGDACGNASCS